MYLNSQEIIELNKRQLTETGLPLLSDFIDYKVRDNVVSYGLSGAGYDVRLGEELYIINDPDYVADPKHPMPVDKYKVSVIDGKFDMGYDILVDYIILPPHSCLIANVIEYFNMPNNVIAHFYGKSTYARYALLVNGMPVENSWQGYYTLNIVNPMNFTHILYPKEGIAQVFFSTINEGAEPYTGKYTTDMNGDKVNVGRVE